MRFFLKLLFLLTISCLMSCGEETVEHPESVREIMIQSLISSEWALLRESSDVSLLKGAINLDSPKNVIHFSLEKDSIIHFEFEGSMTEILHSGQVKILETGVIKNLKVLTNPESEGIIAPHITINQNYSKFTITATMHYECDSTENNPCIIIPALPTLTLTYEKVINL